MARIYLLTAHAATDEIRTKGAYLSLKENALADRFKIHHLVDDPEEADIVLFAEIDVGRLCQDVLCHPYIKQYREKCFMFSSDWRVIPFIPGVYTALEKRYYQPRRVRPGFYPSCLINPLIGFEPDPNRDLLYSFMGDLQTAKVRRTLAQLTHPRAEFVNTSRESQAVMWKGTPEQRAVFWKKYVDLARRSKFVLCPRGVAPSSIRLFEMMAMGRAPVILSDAWVAPEGPRWESFAIQVPERDALSIPAILESRESEAIEMGFRARKEWEEFFSPDLLFHRVVELCLEIKKARRLPENLARWTILPQLLRMHVFREYLRLLKQRVLKPGR
ncbi:glycosyltransferase family 47 protein [Methylacidiphilales bacterium]|nr:glycosyltransferase family 47 protein [Candidatus Methylacidiphilales bacterium]